MANMILTKTPMPEQDPKVRARNFKEVPWVSVRVMFGWMAAIR